jgi:hypothetical protein
MAKAPPFPIRKAAAGKAPRGKAPPMASDNDGDEMPTRVPAPPPGKRPPSKAQAVKGGKR